MIDKIWKHTINFNVILADSMYFQNVPVVTVWIVKTNITQFYEYFQNVQASVKFSHLFEL